MPRNEDILHSVLIISASDQFDEIIKKFLRGMISVEFRKSASSGRRCVLERYYDLIVINAPLPDETGEQFALDIAQQCSTPVLMIVPSALYEEMQNRVTDRGIFVIAKPFSRGQFSHALRYLEAISRRISRLQKQIRTVEEKMEEIRIVDKAKFLLVEQKGMTEDEAHRLIGKQAMDRGLSRKRIAEMIMEDYEG